MCSDVEVLVCTVCNCPVRCMSLEFGRRPTKKFVKVWQERRALWIEANISPSACPLEIHVL